MLTPRPYLSWSQMNLFNRDKQQYYLVYFENVNRFRSKELELGKRLATCLEVGEDEDEEFLRKAKLLPDFPGREFKMEVDFEGIPLFGFLDGFDEENLIIHEVKSGKKWSQSLVNKHGQLDFYALMVYLKYGKLPKEIFLHWIRTERDDNNVLHLTDDVKTFKVTKTMRDIIAFSGKVIKTWKGIKELSKFNEDEKELDW